MSNSKDFMQLVGSNSNQYGESAVRAPSTAIPEDWAQIAAAARCWAQSGDAFFPVTDVVKEIPAGAYRCQMSQRGPYLEKMPIETDNLLVLPDGAVESLLEEFKRFWTLRQNFAERGFTFKRGFMLWGPPGSGKTSGIWQMTQELVRSHNGVVLFVEEPDLASMCVAMLRRIEPGRPLVTVMEDLDALVHRHGEHGYLALLDGETQVSNVVHVATTNYPERLDKRFVDRPSRFDTIMLVDMPTADARRLYLQTKEPGLDEVTLARWVKRTEGYSIAHLREVIIATRCFERPEEEVFERLDQMRTDRPVSDGHGGKANAMGFGRLGAP